MAEKYAKAVANKVIAYAFTAGVVVALVLGLVATALPATVVPYLTSLLILAGVVVGFFNIQPQERKDYVLYVTALVIVLSLSQTTFAQVQYIGVHIQRVLSMMMAFILPSVVIVGIKAVISLARD
ncbi:TPA: hypothetical protein HA241_02680 [Candidatus Woesearchaeota archaeon]|nr:hypothetical protein [Candidatus Woesearchaeota archaeon]